MKRGQFLKSLFALGATTLLPADNILKATDFIEKKSLPIQQGKGWEAQCKPAPFVNHMTIQRKTYIVTGGPSFIEYHFIDNPLIYLGDS